MAECVNLIGLPGAGKTTFYWRHLANTHQLVSKDLWPNARHREARHRRILGDALARGESVVVDNTNPSRQDREPLIAIAHAHHTRVVAYFFDVSTSDAVVRNAGRTRPREGAEPRDFRSREADATSSTGRRIRSAVPRSPDARSNVQHSRMARAGFVGAIMTAIQSPMRCLPQRVLRHDGGVAPATLGVSNARAERATCPLERGLFKVDGSPGNLLPHRGAHDAYYPRWPTGTRYKTT
jgi:hypothetical protein